MRVFYHKMSKVAPLCDKIIASSGYDEGRNDPLGDKPGRMGREACAVGRKKREWPLFFLCLSAALYGLALIFSAHPV